MFAPYLNTIRATYFSRTAATCEHFQSSCQELCEMRLSLLNKQKTKLNKNVAIDWHLRRFVKQKMNVLQQVIDIQVHKHSASITTTINKTLLTIESLLHEIFDVVRHFHV